MPISRLRKKKSKPQKKAQSSGPKPYEVVKHDMVEVRNPFPDNTSFVERLNVFLQMGETASSNFEQEYLNLVGYLKDYDALYLLAFSVFYYLASPEGIDREAIEGVDEYPPFYVEVLQALALFHERSGSTQALGDKGKDFYELQKRLNKNQSYRYFQVAKGVKTEDELPAALLRMEMMSHTLAIRNWAYEPQMQKVTYDLAGLIQSEFKAKLGIDPKQLLDILFNSVALTNNRLNEHLRKLRSFGKGRKYNEVFDLYEAAFPDLEHPSDDERLEMWQLSGKNLKILVFALFAHADLKLPELFIFSIDDFLPLCDFDGDKTTLVTLFDNLSLRFGELKEHNKDHIFLDNPVHQKPFIKLDDGRYFSAINFLFFHLGVDLLERFIAFDADLKNDYLKAKGKYLEDTLEHLFRASFPTGKLFSGSQWRDPITKKDFENDLIVLVNEFAFIIEAKSGTITPPARRGATERLAKTLKELVVEPSEQAIRFQNFLKMHPVKHRFSTKRGVINELDASCIKYFVPLGVTLSNLGSIGANLKKMTDAGLVAHKLEELAPSISITDLEVIFDLLPLEGQKIHYLSRRREFEAHMRFQGDEMDLFAFYLENGFNIGDTEYDQNFHINLTAKSKDIDPFIIGTSRGVKVAKPGLKMTPFWSDLLNMIEKRKGTMWLQSSYILLNAPEADQKMFENAFSQLKTRVIKGRAVKDHNWVLLSCGPERRRYAIIGYPYQHINKQTRNEMLNEILAREEMKNIRGVLIIGQNLAEKHYPYSVIAGRMETEFLDSLDLD